MAEEQSAQEKLDDEALERAAGIIREHFDTCIILVTRCDGKDTVSHIKESGNYYARKAHVAEVAAQYENDAELAVKEFIDEEDLEDGDDDDGEEWKRAEA